MMVKSPISQRDFCFQNAIMHLSLSPPTYPRSGMVGDYWGFARVVWQIPHPWGQFYVANPYILYRDSKNNENLWTNAPTLGRNYADKSLQIPTHCPTWGRWGLTMIGALWLKIISVKHAFSLLVVLSRSGIHKSILEGCLLWENCWIL